MGKIEGRIRYLVTSLAVVALLAIPVSLAAQSATEQEEQQQTQEQEQTLPEARQTPNKQDPSESEPAPAPVAVPHVTGTVLTWNGYRLDLKTADGETQQVAVNKDTERLVEIKPGTEVTIDYRRKIGDFVIAERVRPIQEPGTEAQ